MDLILLALIIAGIVWAVRNRGRLGMLGNPNEKVGTTLVSGVVSGTSRHVEMTISGSGTGTYEKGFNMNMSSESVLHQQFFVRQDDGVEKPVRAWGLNLPIADGQRVTVIYSEAGGKSLPGYIVNHSARQGWPMFSRPSDVAVRLGIAPATVMIFVRAIAAALVVGLLASVLGGAAALLIGVVACPAAFILVVFRDRSRRRRIGAMLLEEYKNRERELLTAPTPAQTQAPAAAAAGVAPAGT